MKVSIAKIRPNPFQVRKHFDRASIEALAGEIETLGFWAALRVRQVGSHYELCFGHRRLEALKILKWKDVDVDVLDLSDDDMAIQAMVENFQREGLSDTEKAAGIQRLQERLSVSGNVRPEYVLARVSKLVGVGERRIQELLQVTTFAKRSQQLIAEKKISAATAVRAHRIGGDAMVETAVKRGLSHHALAHITTELAAIPEPEVRSRVKKAVITGQVRDPEAVREAARKVTRQTEARAGKRPPPDLHVVIRAWTQTMHAWSKKLEEVLAYRDYIEEDTKGADEFKAATRELIDKLKRFL